MSELEVLPGHPPNWREYLESVLGLEVEEEEKVIVVNPEYMDKFVGVLAETDLNAVHVSKGIFILKKLIFDLI